MDRRTGRNIKLSSVIVGIMLLFIVYAGVLIARDHRAVYVDMNYVGADADGHPWSLKLNGDGTFALYDLASSSVAILDHSLQYEWKQDQVLLKYNDGMELCFTVDGKNLFFKEEESKNTGGWQNHGGHDISRLTNGMRFEPIV
ncbi:MAG: hypothetical protein K2N63_11585 [Lachnospiraceae bacterium]|nr:hypothetical protein [Lachnospiraceae bacterium]